MPATENSSAAPLGRRAQNRAARYEQLTNAASEIIAESGLDGLTMLKVAEKVDCAVGTIYTYFDSKSALVAEMQLAAMRTLNDSAQRSRAVLDEAIVEACLDDTTAALARIVGLTHNFTAGPELHPREFELLQLLLSRAQRELTPEDTQRVAPPAMEMIGRVIELFDAAVAVGALRGAEPGAPLDAPDSSLARSIRWAAGLNGALLVSNATSDPSWLSADILDGRRIARTLGNDLLLGWGAPVEQLASAQDFVAELVAEGRLLQRGRSVAELDAAAAEMAAEARASAAAS